MKYYIISSRAISFKLIRHKAIAYEFEGETYITHRTESGVKHETMRSYLASGRVILYSEPHQCESVEQIRAYYNNHKDDEFNYFTANCEHYVSDFRLLNNERVVFRSPQLAIIMLILSIIIAAIIKLIRRK